MRPDIDTWFLAQAVLAAARSTCLRRRVGCLLVNEHNHILSSGHNGVPRGVAHCNEGHACAAALAVSGTNLDGCLATHAEMNALLTCRRTYAIDTCYVTTEPCIHCTKQLMNTSCKRVLALSRYAGGSRQLWLRARSEQDWIVADEEQVEKVQRLFLELAGVGCS